MASIEQILTEHVNELLACTRCPAMHKPVVSGGPVVSKVILVGQAPGDKEPLMGKPFAWTAGKTLFRWFEESLGMDEATFRSRIYMAAVCRCFPGKNPKGGDRVPDKTEIANCRPWLEKEIRILQPKLLILVGKLAIQQFIPFQKLTEVIGRTIPTPHGYDLIPLPHPSGASTWHRTEPGRSLLQNALAEIKKHPTMQF